LQGDVGSGKTIVSMAAMITACENSYQAAIMAPTEILAQQHYQNIKNWASALGLNAVLLIGGLNTAQKKRRWIKYPVERRISSSAHTL